MKLGLIWAEGDNEYKSWEWPEVKTFHCSSVPGNETAFRASWIIHCHQSWEFPLCQNRSVIANCNGFWMKEMIVTNNGISALLHKWPWSPTLLVRITAPVSGQSLVSSACTKGSLREECRNNWTVIDNIIELWECHRAQCQQAVLQSISIPHSNGRTGWKRKN